jgi:hypothetical protein
MSVWAARDFRAAHSGTTFFKAEIDATPITNLELVYSF